LEQIASQLPIFGEAEITGLPIDTLEKPSAIQRPPLVLPQTYDGPIGLCATFFYVLLLWAMGLYLIFFSREAGEPRAIATGVFLLVFPVWMFYWDFNRFVLSKEELRITKRLWPVQEIAVPIVEIKEVHFEQQSRQPRSLVVHWADGRKRRFVSSPLRKKTWQVLVYDLAELGVAVHLGQGATDLATKSPGCGC